MEAVHGGAQEARPGHHLGGIRCGKAAVGEGTGGDFETRPPGLGFGRGSSTSWSVTAVAEARGQPVGLRRTRWMAVGFERLQVQVRVRIPDLSPGEVPLAPGGLAFSPPCRPFRRSVGRARIPCWDPLRTSWRPVGGQLVVDGWCGSRPVDQLAAQSADQCTGGGPVGQRRPGGWEDGRWPDQLATAETGPWVSAVARTQLTCQPVGRQRGRHRAPVRRGDIDQLVS